AVRCAGGRRLPWQVVANSLLSAAGVGAGATAASTFRDSEALSPVARFGVLLAVDTISLGLVACGMSVRTGESLRSVAKHSFTRLFYFAFGYFTLGALLISYLLDVLLLV